MSAELVIATDTTLPVSPTASAVQSVKKEEPRLKKIHKWSREQEVLISEWSDLAMCYRWLHDKSEKFFHSKNRWINIPVIILSTLAGTANFGIQSIFSDPASKQLASFAIGGVSLFAGLLTTIGNYLRYAQLEEGHRVSSISWGKFQRQMAVELSLNPKDRTDSMEFLKMCRGELNRLIEQSPPIPADIIKTFEDRFGQIPNLKRPDICGAIEHTRIYEAPLEESFPSLLEDTIKDHIESKLQGAIDERKKDIEDEIEMKKTQAHHEQEEIQRVMEERQKKINDEIELEKQKAMEVKKKPVEHTLKKLASTIETKSYFSKNNMQEIKKPAMRSSIFQSSFSPPTSPLLLAKHMNAPISDNLVIHPLNTVPEDPAPDTYPITIPYTSALDTPITDKAL